MMIWRRCGLLEHSNNKCYASAFRYIQIRSDLVQCLYVCMCEGQLQVIKVSLSLGDIYLDIFYAFLVVYILQLTNSIVIKYSFINLRIFSIPEILSLSLSLSLSLFSLVFLCDLSWYQSLNPQQWLPQMQLLRLLLQIQHLLQRVWLYLLILHYFCYPICL